MDLICDTNVWYDIDAGRRDPEGIKAAGHRLMATPTSFIEITSKLDEKNFEKRSGAARAVVDFADGMLDDTERHLASLWNLEVEALGIDWLDAFKALAMAKSLQELQEGVQDIGEGVTRKVRLDVAEWARGHWDSFAREVEVLVDKFFPGYLAARDEGQAKYAKKEDAQSFGDESRLPAIERYVAGGTRARAALHMTVPAPPLSEEEEEEELNRIGGVLIPYARAYARYVYNCATKYTPDRNDWGDLECFIYLQEDRRLLTCDKRWLEVAKESDLLSWILDPDASP